MAERKGTFYFSQIERNKKTLARITEYETRAPKLSIFLKLKEFWDNKITIDSLKNRLSIFLKLKGYEG